MIGKPYAEYMMPLKFIHYKLDYMDQPEADRFMEYMHEAAKIAGDRKWQVETDILRIAYRFRYKSRYEPDNNYTIENAITDYKALYRAALQEQDTITCLRMMRGIMNSYYVFAKDYDQAFEMARKLDRELNHITVSAFPEKLLIYREMAEMHYRFRNYVEAESFYGKIIEDPETANRYSLLQPAYNGMALIYRYHYNDLDKSDDYFHHILRVPKEKDTPLAHYRNWEGIANGNLGGNFYRRKDYNEAIPLLEFARKRLQEEDDYSYAANMAVILADIYLVLGSMNECKQYMDMASEYISLSYPNQQWGQLYPVMSKYYTKTGDVHLATAYLDSALISRERDHAEFSALKLMYVEQRLHSLEQERSEIGLKAEYLRAENYKQTVLYVSIGLFLLTALCIYTVILYRRKRVAYRMLVKKGQEWTVSRQTGAVSDSNSVKPSEVEVACMERIRQLMEIDKIYIDPNLNLAELAMRLDINRTYISATINRCTGKNFANYITEYRISEAIHIMSASENDLLTIDTIAFRSGYNDRKSFYRAFKKATGLAPSEFRMNITVDLKDEDVEVS